MLSLVVLLITIDLSGSGILQIPTSLHGDPAAASAALARKMKLKLELANANLIERATDEACKRKVNRNSMHTNAGFRLTRIRPQKSAIKGR